MIFHHRTTLEVSIGCWGINRACFMAHRLNCKLWQYTTFCQAFPIQDFLQWYRPPHLHHQKNITSRHHSQHQFVLRRLYPVVWFCLLVLSHYSYQEKRYLASQTLFFLCTRGRSRWQYNVYLPMAIRSLYHHGSLNYVISLCCWLGFHLDCWYIPNSSTRKYINFLWSFLVRILWRIQFLSHSEFLVPVSACHVSMHIWRSTKCVANILGFIGFKIVERSMPQTESFTRFHQINHTVSRPKLTVATIWKLLPGRYWSF